MNKADNAIAVEVPRLMSPEKAMGVIEQYTEWIDDVASRYGVPAALIKAILYQEMTRMDVLDPLADLAVQVTPGHTRDSSTGIAQIFGHVGLAAANYAIDHELASYESLGLDTDHRLDAADPKDVFRVWQKLHDDPKANIELATLNLLVAADEVVGRTDFGSFSDDEIKLVLTRYNANVRHITAYGEEAFEHYKRFIA